MSVNLNRSSTLEPPETTALTTTDATVVHTASNSVTRVVEAIVLANVDPSNTCYVILSWTDVTPTSLTFWTGTVAAGSTTIIDNVPMLTDGKGKVRSISATAAAGNDINVTVITSSQSRQVR